MITTANFVLTYLGIEETDEKIDMLIALYQEVYLSIRNAPWSVDSDGNNEYPTGSEITIADMIGYKLSLGVTNRTLVGESIGTYSWSGENRTMNGFPMAIVGQIKRYVRGV